MIEMYAFQIPEGAFMIKLLCAHELRMLIDLYSGCGTCLHSVLGCYLKVTCDQLPRIVFAHLVVHHHGGNLTRREREGALRLKMALATHLFPALYGSPGEHVACIVFKHLGDSN